MKYLLAFSCIFFGLIPNQEKFKLTGKYQMQYEEKYRSENCLISFNDSIYVRRLPNGKSIKGHVFYKNFLVSLKDDESNLQMDFLKQEIQKDTIYFGTKDVNEKPSNGLTINSGKLIKIK